MVNTHVIAKGNQQVQYIRMRADMVQVLTQTNWTTNRVVYMTPADAQAHRRGLLKQGYTAHVTR